MASSVKPTNSLSFHHLHSAQVALPSEVKQEIENLVTGIELTRSTLLEAVGNHSFLSDPVLKDAFYSNVLDGMEKVIQYSMYNFPMELIPTEFKDPSGHILMTRPITYYIGQEAYTFDEASLVVDTSSGQTYCPITYAPITESTRNVDLQERIYQFALVALGINTLSHGREVTLTSSTYTAPTTLAETVPLDLNAPETQIFTLYQLCTALEETASLLNSITPHREDLSHSPSAFICDGCIQSTQAQSQSHAQEIARIGERLDSLPHPVQNALFLRMHSRHSADPTIATRVNLHMFPSPVDQGNLLFFDNLHHAISVLSETLMETLVSSELPVSKIFADGDSLSKFMHDGDLNQSLGELLELTGLIKSTISN